MKKFSKGFTLIELLVVIAIIGILSSVVLASLSTARSKGNDAKVQEQLSGLRSAAEIYYGTNNQYASAQTSCTFSTPCQTLANSLFSDTTSGAAAVVAGVGSTTGVTTIVGSASTTGWAMLANLPSTPGSSWCVDSTGASKKETQLTLAAGNVCP